MAEKSWLFGRPLAFGQNRFELWNRFTRRDEARRAFRFSLS